MKTENEDRNLYYLDELSDYKVADDKKDVRGWKVHAADGKIIGEVDDLIVNKNTERVVYLNVKVDESIISSNISPFSTKVRDSVHDFVNEKDENHIIIPIGMASLDLDKEIVYTNKIKYDTFTQTKRFRKHAPLYRDYELEVYNTYTKPEIETVYPDDDEFYEHEDFNW